jgi:hypothetical protein
MKKSRLIALVSLLMMGSSPSAVAAPVELVINGEFESPHFDGGWTTYSNALVPGWSSTADILEFWVQGYEASPENGSDGLPTGQHYELTYYSPAEVTSQTMTVTGSNGTVDFSFDYWHRSGSGVQYSLTGSSSGTIVSGSYNYTPGVGDLNWVPISYTNLPVKAGETLTLSFNGIDGDTMGDHIDQVSVLYNAAAVPEPASVVLMGLGGLGMGYIKRRKSSDVA